MRGPLLLSLLLCLLCAAPAGAATTFGSTLEPEPGGAALDCDRARCAAVRDDSGAPTDGVLLRWRVRADPTAAGRSVALRVVRGTTTVGETPEHVLVSGVQTVAARLTVRKGDRLALVADDPLPAVLAAAGGPTLVEGVEVERELLVNADLEPDLDGDLAGDESEDLCRFDPSRQTTCLSDLTLTASGTGSTVVGEEAAHTYTLRNGGPSGAPGATVTVPTPGGFVRASMTGGGTCVPAGGVVRCRTDVLRAGGSVEATIVLTALEPGDVRTAGRGSSDADESRKGDEEASATTQFTPPSVAPPPLVLPMIACDNPFFGGRDDDALFGTPFGDRMVGLGGRDLLRGSDGDDCLEGGEGNDVLDGGAGADRLQGGAGRDRLLGGPGDDRLRGGLKNDRLAGGPGNDVLEPNAGADSVDAGPGNDRIFSRDRVRERIDCGPGRDTVTADRRDRLRGCEVVRRR